MLARLDLSAAPEQRGIVAAASAWAGASTTVVTSGGVYRGKRTRTYTFTGPGSLQLVGAGTWYLTWSDGAGNTGSLSLGSGYSGGTALAVGMDGLTVAFTAGGANVAASDTFTVACTAWRRLRRDHRTIQTVQPTFADLAAWTRRSRDDVMDLDNGDMALAARSLNRSINLTLDYMTAATFNQLAYLEQQRAFWTLAEDYNENTVFLLRGGGTTPFIGPDGVYARSGVASLVDARSGLSRHVAAGSPRIVAGSVGRALQLSTGAVTNLLANGHPQSGTLGWGVSGTSTIAWDSTQPTMLDPLDTTWAAVYRAGCARVNLVSGDAVDSWDASFGALAANTDHVATVWLKGRGTLTMHIRSGVGSPANSRANVAITLTPTWTQYSLKGTFLAGDTRADIWCLGTSASHFYIGAAQLEAASAPSSLIQTNGATASRSADTLTFPLGVPVDVGTVAIRFYWAGYTAGGSSTYNLVQSTGMGGGERWGIWYSEGSSGTINFYTLIAGVLQATSLNLSTGWHEIVCTWQPSTTPGQLRRYIYLDGVQRATDSTTSWGFFGTGIDVCSWLGGANAQHVDYRLECLRIDNVAWSAIDVGVRYTRWLEDDWLQLREFFGRHFLMTGLNAAVIDDVNWDKIIAMCSLQEAGIHESSVVIDR